MSLIDTILNLAAVLLWFGWRSVQLDPLTRTTPATLVGTLRRAAPRRVGGWQLLTALGLLLLVRAWLYRQVGPEVDWTPKLDLTFVVLAFRSSRFMPMVLFSLLSFLRILLICYAWLLTLTIVNRSNPEPAPIQRMVRQHLGMIARWPRTLQVVLPFLVVLALWLALHPLLVQAGVVGHARASFHLVEQGLLLGVALCLSLQYFLPLFLFAHLISSYVYLGTNPLWDFVGVTSRNLLKPLRSVPLRFAKFDFAPLVGAALIFLLLHWVPNRVMSAMAARNAHNSSPGQKVYVTHWLWPE